MIQFFVFGNPIALKRHRKGKFGNYDPSANDKKDFLAKCIAHKPETPLKSPLGIEIEFVFKRPKNHYNSRGLLKPDTPFWHTKRPDSDNLVKFVLDALNGIYWEDDAIICKQSSVKRYVDDSKEQSGINIKIIEL